MSEQNENKELEVTPVAEENLENTQEQYTGCDEELSQEVTDEQYDEFMGEVEVAEKKPNAFVEFIKGLQNQAVCNLMFIFAAVGFILPFFTVSCDNQVFNAHSTTGFATFKKMTFALGEYGNVTADKQLIVIAAFAFIVLGLLITVFFKNQIRYIGGLVCSVASAACLFVFYRMLPAIMNDSLTAFLKKISKELTATWGEEIDLTLAETQKQMGLDLSGLKPIAAMGLYFVLAILAINAIYFIVMLIIDSKKKADEDIDIEAMFGKAEEVGEEAVEEIAEETVEEAIEEAAEETAEETTEE